MKPDILNIHFYESPVGLLRICMSGPKLCVVSLGKFEFDDLYIKKHFWDFNKQHTESPIEIREAFDRYFGGEIAALASVRTQIFGTKFQLKVWRELQLIPPGETKSYSDIATAIGQPASARAVGRANAQNPIAIVIPCHRVIGASQRLVGYGGGLAAKQWLLQHEAGRDLFSAMSQPLLKQSVRKIS